MTTPQPNPDPSRNRGPDRRYEQASAFPGQVEARNTVLDIRPGSGIAIIRVVGNIRTYGFYNNAEHLPEINGDVEFVIDAAFRKVSSLLRRPARLGFGGRFQATPEYPDFAWQESIINAVAHRDYARVGEQIQIILYGDRLTVISPGAPDGIRNADHLIALVNHPASYTNPRNPELMRALSDLGIASRMRGGLRRIFCEMDVAFLPPPEIRIDSDRFAITLRNDIAVPQRTGNLMAWIQDDLSADDKKVIIKAHRDGQVTIDDVRTLLGQDSQHVAGILTDLRELGLLQQVGTGGAAGYIVNPSILGD